MINYYAEVASIVAEQRFCYNLECHYLTFDTFQVRVEKEEYQYGVMMDAGSSGSRLDSVIYQPFNLL